MCGIIIMNQKKYYSVKTGLRRDLCSTSIIASSYKADEERNLFKKSVVWRSNVWRKIINNDLSILVFNPLMLGGNKKGHTYLNKPPAFSCKFV